MADANPPSEASAAGHELSDLSPRKIALFAMTLTATIGVVFCVCYVLFRYFDNVWAKNQVALSPLSFTREPTPEPRLSVQPGDELQTLRKQEDSVLNSYGWVDQEKGIVRIPIERAVEIVAQRGLPGAGPRRDTAARTTPSHEKKENR